MRRTHFLVLAVSASLLAAACSSDKAAAPAATDAPKTAVTTGATDAESNPTTPDATTVETPAATNEVTDTTPATDPQPEGVTLGSDGRLVPAPCQGTNAADEASGVTDAAVNISTLSIDFKQLAAIGFAPSASDVRQWFQLLVDDLNAKGGVCGRTINYQGVLYDRILNEGGKGCIQVTQDVTNLMVLVQGGTPEAVCVAETGAVTYTQHDFSKAELAGVLKNIFVRAPSWDEQVLATVQYAIDSGQLEGKKVGVWYGSIFLDQGDTVERLVFPLFDKAGIDYIPFRTDFVGPSDPQGNTVLLAAASEYTSAKIDVLLNFTGTTNHTAMQSELAAQGLIPAFISAPISANSSNAIFAKASGVETIANGENIVSFTKAINEIKDENPAVVSCHKQFTALGLAAIEPGTFDYAASANMCLQFDMVVAALSIAGGDLTRETMISAMESLPAHPGATIYGEEMFTADNHFSPASWAVHLYDGATNSYSTTNPFEFAG